MRASRQHEGGRLSRHAPLIALMVLSTATAGLGGCSPPKERVPLRDRVHLFNTALRWERHDTASAMALPMAREDLRAHLEEQASARKITDVERLSVRRPGPDEAVVRVKVEWIAEASTIVKTEIVVEKWTRSEGHWFLADLSVED